MSHNNVFIEHFRSGVLVDSRSVHNTWTEYGREYLTKVVSLQSMAGPGVPQEDHRIRYMGFGIGGTLATAAAFTPLLTTSYASGADPRNTDGNEYNKVNPTSPLISTLERPVRRSGSEDPYLGGPTPGDVWLFGAPSFSTYYRDNNSVTYKTVVDCSNGDITYGSFVTMPITEAGLYHSGADSGSPFSELVAYVNFDTITLDTSSFVTFSWTVRLAP